MRELFLHDLLHVAGVVGGLALIVFGLVELTKRADEPVIDRSDEAVPGDSGLLNGSIARGLESGGKVGQVLVQRFASLSGGLRSRRSGFLCGRLWLLH